MVLQNADRTLRDGGADNIRTHRLNVPSQLNLIATHSSGILRGETRTVHNRFNHYVINMATGGVLVEQVIAVGADALDVLADELKNLSDNLYRLLLNKGRLGADHVRWTAQ